MADKLEIGTKDWAEEIVKELSELGNQETQEQVLDNLKIIANQLDSFLKEFRQIRDEIFLLNKKVEREEQFSSVINKYHSDVTVQSLQVMALSDAKNYVYAESLYSKVLQYTVIGYYLLNKIRDTFFIPITYAIGFYSENGEDIEYVEGIEIEELLEGVGTLSNRVDITKNNFARLEINIEQVIEKMRREKKTKSLSQDVLFQQIQQFTSHNLHTYTSNSHKRYKEAFKMGYIWETYRHMKAYGLKVSSTGRNVHYYYEQIRKGNLAYYKGGDVLSEQDKFGTSFALTSTAAILNQLSSFTAIFKKDLSASQIAKKLERIFLQKVTPKTDKFIRDYVQQDRNKLLSILKITSQ